NRTRADKTGKSTDDLPRARSRRGIRIARVDAPQNLQHSQAARFAVDCGVTEAVRRAEEPDCGTRCARKRCSRLCHLPIDFRRGEAREERVRPGVVSDGPDFQLGAGDLWPTGEIAPNEEEGRPISELAQ